MSSSRDSSDNVSLFPFLAVLLCTMGSLVVLLFVVARRAQLQAAVPAAKAAAAAADLPRKLAALTHRQSRLDRRLDRGRQVLQHLEQRIRALHEKMAQLKQAAGDLGQTGQSSAAQLARDRAELARLRKLTAEAEQELDRLRREAAGRSPSYAIVPYQGARQTHRRPLYVECLADRIVLQPEGIELARADFQSPLGPGNPLAAALRAASQYYGDQQLGTAGGQRPARPEPYPLLLVRPGGIVAYYRVLDAIADWEGQFGYELVQDDWQLEFPTPDPQLARVEQQAVDLARARQERLARAAPSQYGRRGGQAGGAAAGGGFEPFEIPDPDTEAAPDPFGPGSFVARRRAAVAGAAAAAEAAGNAGNDSGSRIRENSGRSQYAPKSHDLGYGQNPAISSQKNRSRRWAAGAKPNAPALTGAGAAGSAGRNSANAAAQAASSSAAAGPGATGKGHDAATTAAAGGSSQSPQSLAAKRGRNWALPDGGRNGVPIRRPVRVLVRGGRIAILPETAPAGARTTAGRVVLLEGSTTDAMDQFVTMLWDQVQSWGIAGEGMYWKPVLSLQVTPAGRPRARQLRTLLHDSGLEIVEEGTLGERGGAGR